MNRLVIFADPRDVATRILLPAVLQSLQQRSDLHCVALALPEDAMGLWPLLRHWLARGARCLQVQLGSGRRERAVQLAPIQLLRLARRQGAMVIALPGGDPNHARVVSCLREQLQANLALNLYCKTLFRDVLLDSFDMTVNYHNGSLPAFRGLRASNWSIYTNAPVSGFSFHRMDQGLDTGSVLCAGEVPVKQGETPADLELRKAEEACRCIPQLLDALVGRYAGKPQVGIGGDHNRQAYLLATRVEDPAALSSDEWQRRLQAFLRINVQLGRRWWPVTGVAACAGPQRWAFRCVDGQWLRITGIDFWPAWMRALLTGSAWR